MSCNVEACEHPARSRGYCGTHYQQLRRTGSPLRSPRVIRPCAVEGCDEPMHAHGGQELTT